MRRRFRPRRPPRRPRRGTSFLPVTVAALLMLILSLFRLFGCSEARPPGEGALRYSGGELLELLAPLFVEDGVELTHIAFGEDGFFTLAGEADCARLQQAGALPSFEAGRSPEPLTLSGVLEGRGGQVSCRQLRLTAEGRTLPLEGEYRAGFEALVLAFCSSVCAGQELLFDSCEIRDGALLITGV